MPIKTNTLISSVDNSTVDVHQIAKVDLSNVDQSALASALQGAGGPGSGLDADTVDGVQAAQLVRNDVFDAQMSGEWFSAFKQVNAGWAQNYINLYPYSQFTSPGAYSVTTIRVHDGNAPVEAVEFTADGVDFYVPPKKDGEEIFPKLGPPDFDSGWFAADVNSKTVVELTHNLGTTEYVIRAFAKVRRSGSYDTNWYQAGDIVEIPVNDSHNRSTSGVLAISRPDTIVIAHHRYVSAFDGDMNGYIRKTDLRICLWKITG